MTNCPLYAKIHHYEWDWICIAYPGAGEVGFPRIIHIHAHDPHALL